MAALCGIKGAGAQETPAAPDTVVVTEKGGTLVKADGIIATNPGPWGEMDYFYTYLEAPQSLVDLLPVPSQQTVWRFPGFTPEQVRAIFAAMPLTSELQSELVERSVWHIADNGTRVHPSARFLEALPPESRIALYRVLRRFNENPYHHNPVVIESGDVAAWFQRAGLSELALKAIAGLAYPLGDSLAFSDLPYLLGLMSSDEEERAMIKAMTRTRTMVLRLRISKDSDTESLREYWTAGYKYKDVLPILESIQRVEGVERIDVAHLVPPLPRKLLYTYPTLAQGLTGRYPDSFWTAMNFFQFMAREDYLDGGIVQREIAEKFEPVQPPYRYGDMLLMIEPESRRALHASIYIADDIVFTKNGSELLQPWLLMRMPDLLTRLATEQQPLIEGWRRKAEPKAVIAPSGP